MRPATTLAFSGVLHQALKRHLFPGDGLEAAAILICSQGPEPRSRLIVRSVILVPHAACDRRAADALTWPGASLEQALDQGEAEALVLILIHSHPGGLFAFSDVDDASDRTVLPCLFQAFGTLHGSAIMTADGAVRARLYTPAMIPKTIDLVTVAGDDLRFCWSSGSTWSGPPPRPVAFTQAMREELSRLTAVIIGVSGTGSIIAEQAARLGFGRVLMIDFDRVEAKNLNRILNATLGDVRQGRLKVEAFARAVDAYRGPDVAVPLAASIIERQAVLAASQGDVLFSCVDSLEARQLADLIASAFLIPLFDLGVVIPVRRADQGVAIADVCGRIDYIQPGGSTLGDRGVYTPESLRAEYLRRAAPLAHQDELEAGYIKGVIEEAPSVITLNMRAAAACMNEFIARAYPFRLEPNQLYARTRFSLAACEEEYEAESAFTAQENPILGRGAVEPLLGLPGLAAKRVAS